MKSDYSEQAMRPPDRLDSGPRLFQDDRDFHCTPAHSNAKVTGLKLEDAEEIRLRGMKIRFDRGGPGR